MNDHEFAELRLLRDLRSSDIDPTDTETARGLAALERGIEAHRPGVRSAATGSSRAPRRAPRRVVWGAIGVVAIGALVGVTVVTAPDSLWGSVAPQSPQAQATALLERSAELLPELTVSDGQFLRVGSYAQQVMSKPVLEGGGEVTYMTREHRVHYIPSDLSDAWTFRFEEEVPDEILLPAAPEASSQEMIELVSPHIALGVREDQHLAGRFPLTPEGEVEAAAALPSMEADQLRRASAPIDPAALRNFLLEEFQLKDSSGIVLSEDQQGIVRTDDAGNELPVEEWFYAVSEDEVVRGEIFTIVSDEAMPRSLRAACLQLLTHMPDVTAEAFVPPAGSPLASSVSKGVATVITVREHDSEQSQLIFDEGSSRLIGTQIVLTETSDRYPGVEPGTVVFVQALNTTVVDAVPAAETW